MRARRTATRDDLHAHSIRYAIANGFEEYDFSQGNEPYKYSFGVKERRIRCVAIATKNGLNLGGKLDRRTIPDALKEATELHQNRKLAEAERCYRQILDVEPRNADAIHRLGELLTTRENHIGAKRLFKMLTTIRPDLYKPWLSLAQSCEALGQYLEAADSYRAVIKLAPEVPDAFTGIGRVLLKLGRMREFDASLDALLTHEEKRSDRCGRDLKTRGIVEHRSPYQPVWADTIRRPRICCRFIAIALARQDRRGEGDPESHHPAIQAVQISGHQL
jgi:tetratricopeptide (TPR) repeat protein